MFKTYHSQSQQTLARHFSGIIKPDSQNPFSKPWVIVQNNEIKEWLSLKIAEEQGIAGNIRFIFPSEFLWMLYRLQKDEIPQVLPADLNSMHWALFELLSSNKNLLDQIPFYDSGSDTSKKRFQLCGQLADIFDQYQVYRPEMMESWLQRQLVTKDPNERWQLSIWNALNEQWTSTENIEHLPSRSQAYSELVEWLDDANHELWSGIPGNVYVFGLSHLSKPFMEIISRIGKKHDVHFFSSEKADDHSNEDLKLLLDDWGRSTQEQLQLLHEILDKNEVPTETNGPENGEEVSFPSFKVHSCHNIRREVQVLKDEVLRYLDNNPQSRLSDVLVMIPDVEAYSGMIETVFTSDVGEPAVPVSKLSGRNYHSSEHTLSEVLELLSSPFKASAVLQLLNNEPVKAKFSFSDADLELIEGWVLENRIYQGVGNDFNTRYSWKKGVNQLLSGFSMEPETLNVYQQMVPYDRISSSDDAMLSARLAHFIHLLRSAADKIANQKTPVEWIVFTRRLIDDFIGDENTQNFQAGTLRKMLDKLKEQASFTTFSQEVPFTLLKDWLVGQLSNHDSSSGRFGQGVTVSSYIPYRSVPFRFIALLGMNESVFPRKAIRPEFDLIYADPKPADRILKEDDTYLFLETIQAAREHLHISYRGQDQHSESTRLPSILVQQLLDVFFESQKEGIIRHSLHPFNKQYFVGDNPNSYSDINRQLSERMQKGKREGQPVFIDPKLTSIEKDPQEQTHLSDLISFFISPSKYILQNQLSLSSYNKFKEISDRESFKLNSLDRYKLDHLLFEMLQKNETVGMVRKYASAAAMIPEALEGDKVFNREKESVADLLKHLKSYTEAGEHTEEISIEVAGIQLYGPIHGLYGDLLVSYRVGQRRAEHEVEHWLKHLVLLQSGYNLNRSLYLSKDGADIEVLEIRSSDIQSNPLSEYVEFFFANNPVLHKAAFFPQSSKAYADAVLDGKDPEEAVKKARAKWEVNPHKLYAEEADYYNALLWRGYDPMALGIFKENALKFWEPFLQAQREEEV
ncbi:MAG: exodeoxyribonuclease V subunit gamma [Gracilimonas sp.]|uniref:exodeoxyribonuclease V subunit gamma n=1 Tax=Gracilimonas TaxID=649462 RepID=UPI001B109ADF|nr:exodeoxyribonuclease V subunit gamma [Gracilimonas sp.]MBO6586517.1 exodeoxyribonuclease V subunit gamma [Gracilimonas sp.]MBO6615174.1 exodeoxyribonuclease V subunit gamma [Gracilimonas sp.]